MRSKRKKETWDDIHDLVMELIPVEPAITKDEVRLLLKPASIAVSDIKQRGSKDRLARANLADSISISLIGRRWITDPSSAASFTEEVITAFKTWRGRHV